MKVGIDYPREWKEKSAKLSISLADFVYGIVVEDILQRIEASYFSQYMLLQNEQALGIDAYKKKVKERLDFYYLQKEGRLTLSSVEVLVQELLKQENDIHWEYRLEQNNNSITIYLQADYFDMQLPVTLCIEELFQVPKVNKTIEYVSILHSDNISCICCCKENILSENVFEMMKKLELIADMGVYATINDIIKTYALNGKQVREALLYYIEKEPKILTMKRLEQMNSYISYGYMKKRWQQYTKRQGILEEEWNVVLERILKFVKPVWAALCNNEIFLDDWMPELERFLG